MLLYFIIIISIYLKKYECGWKTTKYSFLRSGSNFWATMYHLFVGVCCSSNVVVIERHIKRLLCKSLYSIIESMQISQKIHCGDIYPNGYNTILIETNLTSKKFITLNSVIFAHFYLYSHSASCLAWYWNN